MCNLVFFTEYPATKLYYDIVYGSIGFDRNFVVGCIRNKYGFKNSQIEDDLVLTKGKGKLGDKHGLDNIKAREGESVRFPWRVVVWPTTMWRWLARCIILTTNPDKKSCRRKSLDP